jgi:hypothetical protein
VGEAVIEFCVGVAVGAVLTVVVAAVWIVLDYEKSTPWEDKE